MISTKMPDVWLQSALLCAFAMCTNRSSNKPMIWFFAFAHNTNRSIRKWRIEKSPKRIYFRRTMLSHSGLRCRNAWIILWQRKQWQYKVLVECLMYCNFSSRQPKKFRVRIFPFRSVFPPFVDWEIENNTNERQTNTSIHAHRPYIATNQPIRHPIDARKSGNSHSI